jgi:hypothetical protein
VVRTGADSKRGRVGPGADSSRIRKCERICVGRGLVEMGSDSKRGHVGLGIDSSHVRDCGRKCIGRKRGLMGAGG